MVVSRTLKVSFIFEPVTSQAVERIRRNKQAGTAKVGCEQCLQRELLLLQHSAEVVEAEQSGRSLGRQSVGQREVKGGQS